MSASVKEIQNQLKLLGFDPGPVDGIFGNKTRAAIIKFQKLHNLAADGIAGPLTQAKLFTPVHSAQPFTPFTPLYSGRGERLTDAQFNLLAAQYGFSVPALKAIVSVEAAGSGFYSTGELKCLYEPHVAYRYSSGRTREELIANGLAYRDWVAGKYPSRSFARIDQATGIAGPELAALATSWGMGQIMGFNAKGLGYPDAVTMVREFADSERAQLDGMLRFISQSPGMTKALKNRDWDTFARLYNGPKYKVNKYHTKLADAYARYS